MAGGNPHPKNNLKGPGPGRKKGGKNSFPTGLKEKVLFACARLEAEGKDLSSVASADPPWFYVNFVKPMLPKEITVDADVKIIVEIDTGRSLTGGVVIETEDDNDG